MKITHIILLVALAVATGVVISLMGDAGTYVTFTQAEDYASKGSNKKVHVVGTLLKDATGQPEGLYYNPVENPNYFSFPMADTLNKVMTVVYKNPKPADFERSERIVIIGSIKNGVFVADEILMKCPSKYTETEVKENT